MIPFFGGNIKQNIETFSNESLLENRSGKSATFKHKQEINSLYDKKPENIYGNPAFTTQVELDRYIHQEDNEFIWQSERKEILRKYKNYFRIGI